MKDSKKMILMMNAFFINAYGITSFNPQGDKCKHKEDWTEEIQGFVVLIGMAIGAVFCLIACIMQRNLSLFVT